MEWTLINICLTFVVVALLTTIHELGHVAVAKLLGLRIYKIGGAFKPLPHVYIAAEHPKVYWQKWLYLMIGNMITILLFIIGLYFFNIHTFKWLYLAFSMQIIIETNPFFSDYTIIQGKGMNYAYTWQWYIHFAIWTSVIIFLIKLYQILPS